MNRRIVLMATGWIIVVSFLLVAGVSAWRYVTSFQEVTFRYDTNEGYVKLASEDAQDLYPKSGEPARIKKGDYTMTSVGDRIATNTQFISIDSDTTEIKTTFSYTESFLEAQYKKERTAIEQALHARYPHIKSDYILSDGMLYGKADIYGATLTARAAGENSDTLHVLLQKKDGEWSVLKTPQPILTVVDYPDINRDILRAINREK